MIWLSIDPSKAGTGVAKWDGTELKRSLVIKPRGTKGAYYFGDEIVVSRGEAYQKLAGLAHGQCYIEWGMGVNQKTTFMQGIVAGMIIDRLVSAWLPEPKLVVVSEWRRVIKEDCGVSWPQSRERKKELAIDLVKQLYGRTVCDDEADAILLGRACIRMFNIK